MYSYEKELSKNGIKYISGSDEVGRGCWAGPLVAASVVLPLDYKNDKIVDSKKLNEAQREALYETIVKDALAFEICLMSAEEVDKHNPKQSSRLAMKKTIESLKIKPEHCLIDFEKLDITLPSTSIVKGDDKSITIAAASIVAKVTRDRYMRDIDKKYPMYFFKDNKGYGVAKHAKALEEFGVIDEHRKSYKPIIEIMKKSKF